MPPGFEEPNYRAANWIYIGQTTGRGRMDREHKTPSTTPEGTTVLYGCLRGGMRKPRISRMFSRLPRALRSASAPSGDRAWLIGSLDRPNLIHVFFRERFPCSPI